MGIFMKKPVFRKFTIEDLIEACKKSICFADVCKHLNVSYTGRMLDRLRYAIGYYEIDISHFDVRRTFTRNKDYSKVGRKPKVNPKLTEIDKIRDLVKSCICYSDICRGLKISICSRNFDRLKKIISENEIDISHFDSIKASRKKLVRRWDETNVFVENCSISRSQLRPVLIRLGFYTGICDECGISDTWNDKPLTIELDHINGDHTDNRKVNLRWLCPNCHSQTETYRRKNIKTGVDYVLGN